MTGTPAQLPLDLGHRPAMGADDFLVAPSNEAAVAWLDLWPNWPAPALVIFGPAGCGKTHLAQVWRARTQAPRVEPGDLRIETLPRLLSEAAAVVIDNADRGTGDARAERALFHLYNLARETGGHLLLTSESAPARWGINLPDLRSRLMAAPAVAVGAPDDALLAAILVKLFADRQLRVGHDVIRFLVTHMERSFDAARRLVADLDAAALAARRRITVPLARRVLARA
ncbi:HdaA/DnaA family protein [Skermanella mucosa]|uniref:HdaA/DnaA family protein n=1 Tax=Skermanella mucosa TaxID=1789672 RepID=UPI002B1F2C4E|nr:DnaA/Hda family protein [Skermanella mucosa]